MNRIGPGTFVAVVGPSGVGKDTLLDYARARTAPAEAGGPLFVRRAITRPAGPGETHQPISEAEFALAQDVGGYAISWRAHGLGYGLPTAVNDAVGAGRLVVANVSRGVLGILAEAFDDLRVVRVSVSPQVQAKRLLARGREDSESIAARIARADPDPSAPVDLEIVNDSTVEEAGRLLVVFLRQIAAAHFRLHPHG